MSITREALTRARAAIDNHMCKGGTVEPFYLEDDGSRISICMVESLAVMRLKHREYAELLVMGANMLEPLLDELERLHMELARAYEKGREDAAKICDDREADHNRYASSSGCQDWNRVSGLAREAAKCAARIRGK